MILQMAAARADAELAVHWERSWGTALGNFPSTPSPYGRMLHEAIGAWVAQATGRPIPTPPDDLTDAFIAMSNPHFIGAVETVVRAWLDAGRHDLAASAAARSAPIAAESDATRLMRASGAPIDAWVTGSATSARTAAALAREHGAPWWELRALGMEDPRTRELEKSLGLDVGPVAR